MKIYFERSGGFAGISSSTMVDIHSLPPDEAHKIQDMIDNAKFFDLKNSTQPKHAADYFKYKITVQTEEEEEGIAIRGVSSF